MTILIGRYAGHVTLHSTQTGRIISATAEEWANLLDRIKSGQLDYTAEPTWKGKSVSEMTTAEAQSYALYLASGAPAQRIEHAAEDARTCTIQSAHSPHNSPGFADCPGVD